MSSIVPSVGRVLLFYSGGTAGVQSDAQPFAASVAFVHNPTCVNLGVVDHAGMPRTETSVPLRDPSDDDKHSAGRYATWMPYQIGQAKKAEGT